MVATTPRFDRMVPAAPDTVGAVRRELRRWARRQGASPPVQANVALAFSEACNSLLGPDPPREAVPGPLMIQAWRDAEEIALRVSHGAYGGRPAPVGVGYGFGLALLGRICDRFEVRRRERRPGTTVEMAFRVGPAREPERSFPLRRSRSTPRR